MIMYALVARGSLILAEYTDYMGDFNELAKKILMHNYIPKQKKSFIKDDLKITFFSEDDFTFLCMNRINYPHQITSQFLDHLAEVFFSNHGKFDQSQPIQEWGVTFSRKIKNLMEEYDERSMSFYAEGEEELLNKGKGAKGARSRKQNGYELALKRIVIKSKRQFTSLEIMKNYIRKNEVDIKGGYDHVELLKNGIMVMAFLVALGTLTYLFH